MSVAAALVAGAVAYLVLAVPLAICVGLCLRGRCVPVGEGAAGTKTAHDPRSLNRFYACELGLPAADGPCKTAHDPRSVNRFTRSDRPGAAP